MGLGSMKENDRWGLLIALCCWAQRVPATTLRIDHLGSPDHGGVLPRLSVPSEAAHSGRQEETLMWIGRSSMRGLNVKQIDLYKDPNGQLDTMSLCITSVCQHDGCD